MKYTELTALAWVLFLIGLLFLMGVLVADLGIDAVVSCLEKAIESGRVVR